jgi:tRNA uridine 5-carboxymethylaminomethyl modification enzyme
MIDDLVTRGAQEPYRMFTSRAEYRLRLRADNADQRLTPYGMDIGCVGSVRAAAFNEKASALTEARALSHSLSLTPNEAATHGIAINHDGRRRPVHELLAYPEINVERLGSIWPELLRFSPAVREQLEIDGRYAGYMDRQDADVIAFRKDEQLALPETLDYAAVAGLSNEIREKLVRTRPATLGAAARISGVTPAALTALLGHVRRAGERQKRRA